MKNLHIQIITVALVVHLRAVQNIPFTHRRSAKHVGSKYATAIKTYNAILNWTLSTVEDFDPELTVPKPISDNVRNASDDFVKHLKATSENVDSLSNQVNAGIEKDFARVAKIEANIRAQNAKITTTKANVERKQRVLDLATQNLNTAQANVQIHINALDVLEKAKRYAVAKCFGRRRFRRGAGAVLFFVPAALAAVGGVFAYKFIKMLIERKNRQGGSSPGWQSLKPNSKKSPQPDTSKDRYCKRVRTISADMQSRKNDVKNAERLLDRAQRAQANAVARKNTAVQRFSAAQEALKPMYDEKEKFVANMISAKQMLDSLVYISININQIIQQIHLSKGHQALRFNFETYYLLDVGRMLRGPGMEISGLQCLSSNSGFVPRMSNVQIADIRKKLITLKEKGIISAEVPESEEVPVEKASNVQETATDNDDDIMDTNVLQTSDVDLPVKWDSERKITTDDDDDDIIDTNI